MSIEIKTLQGYDDKINTQICRLERLGYEVKILTTHVDPQNTHQLTVVVQLICK